jgi:uncharacterized protein (DUF1800 family)
MNHRRTIGAALCALLLAACSATAGPESAGREGPSEEAAAPVLAPVDTDVIRFLEQASMGASLVDYNDIVTHGGSAGYAGYSYWIARQMDPVKTPISLYVAGTDVRDQFFNFAINKPDQLRQRVALALAEILVVSRAKLKSDDWMTPYLKTLSVDAFGNFRTLLTDVAESAAMGYYLDNANNFVASYDPTSGLSSAVAPNENFAREVMQLFTLGLCKLNNNGTLNGGACVAPYDQDDVESFAHAMSGWTFDTLAGTGACPGQAGKKRAQTAGNPALPLIPCDFTSGGQTDHDYASQPLLNGFSTGAGAWNGTWKTRDAMETNQGTGTGTDTRSGVIDNLFRHANVAPFISKQLIQHLVTSNPTNAYVSRVASVFNNDGTGVRGNLGAVVKAILLDPGVAWIDARDQSGGNKYGHLREPALYVTGAVRLFGASSDGTGLRAQSAAMGQDIHYSPTVFNYFPPSYPLPGATDDSVAPEFGIEDNSTAFARANFADAFVYNPALLSPTLSFNAAQLPSAPADLVDWLAAYGMHGKMTNAMRNTLLDALGNPANLTADQQRRRAAYLVLSSSQYQVSR